jgi:hypothetical protein
MTTDGLVCWKCGASLAGVSLPMRRLEVCKSCDAELHCCRMCVFYDTTVAKHCREPVAEEVRDKTSANFCDYFQPKPGAWVAPESAASKARAELDALFGGGAAAAGDAAAGPRSALEDLFAPRRK